MINLFKNMASFIVIFTFVGCSVNPRVHLYFSDETTEQQQQLVSLLKENNFSVKEFHTSVPDLEIGNYIVYYPERNNEKRAESINFVLRSVSLSEAQAVPFRIGSGIGSHEYTKGNIGLYIIKNDPASIEKNATDNVISSGGVDITEEQFGSKDCNDAFLVEFYDDGRAFFINEESLKKQFEARWEISGSILMIRRLFSLNKFQIKNHTVSKAGNTFAVTDLVPVDGKKAPFNCVYSTYFKEGIYKLSSS